MTNHAMIAVLGGAALSLVLATGRAPEPYSVTSCRAPADAIQNRLSPWIVHTVRDTSSFSRWMRGLSGLPSASHASVSTVTDQSVCSRLATRFAVTAPSRNTHNVSAVAVYAVDSTFYVVTDFGGGPTEPQVTVNADSTLTLDGRSRWVDAMTVNRRTGAVKLWRWEYLPEFATPYEAGAGAE